MTNRCFICGENNSALLDEHHIIPQRLGGSDDSSNLVTLCANCHRAIETIYDDQFFRKISNLEIRDDQNVRLDSLGDGSDEFLVEDIEEEDLSDIESCLERAMVKCGYPSDLEIPYKLKIEGDSLCFEPSKSGGWHNLLEGDLSYLIFDPHETIEEVARDLFTILTHYYSNEEEIDVRRAQDAVKESKKKGLLDI